VTDPLADFRRDYTPPFLAYLVREDEAGLRAAYELGRQAMSRGVGLMGLVTTHNEVLLDVIGDERTAASAYDSVRAACTFLVEALASFEMTQRGFMDGALRRRASEPDRDSTEAPSPTASA
jgi:Phosphoserine phosphatase RsbU, N-terminal domain